MLRFYSRTVALPVLCQSEESTCGTSHNCIVDFAEGKAVAFSVTAPGLIPHHSLVLLEDIIEWDDHLTIRNMDVLTDGSDVVRLQDVLHTKHLLVGLPARTTSGDHLGSVLDFLFDDVSGLIMKFFIGRKKLIGEPEASYVIARDAIDQITPEALIVRDNPPMTEESAGETMPNWAPEALA